MKAQLTKLILAGTLALLSVQFLYGQSWFEGNPSWNYEYDWFCIYNVLGHSRIVYKKDTIIDNQSMKIFTGENYRNEMGMVEEWQSNFIMYDNLDKVYIYANGNSTLLYDFTKEIGDVISYNISNDNTCEPSLLMELDTILERELNSHPVRVQKWKLLNNNEFFGEEITIVEKIGATGNFYFFMSYNWHCGLDHCYPYQFNCYHNEALDISYPSSENCSDLFVDLNEIENNSTELYPNPNNGLFQLDFNRETKKIIVYNLQGEIISVAKKVDFIDISKEPSGLYYLKVIYGNNRIEIKPFIKN